MRKHVVVAIFAFLASSPLWADAACEEQCGLDYWTCSDNCGAFGGALCEQQCVDAYNSCIHRCRSCPSTRDYSTSIMLSKQLTQPYKCLEEYANAGRGYRFDEYYVRYKVTNYRETTNCDGTKTTVVLSSYNTAGSCWKQVTFPNNTCSPYSSVAYPPCGF